MFFSHVRIMIIKLLRNKTKLCESTNNFGIEKRNDFENNTLSAYGYYNFVEYIF